MDEPLLRAVTAPAGAPRRVAVVSLHTSPAAALGQRANGGMNVYVSEVCRAFSAAGVQTDVFTRRVNANDSGEARLTELSRIIELPAGPPDLDRYQLHDEVQGFAQRVAEFAQAQRVTYDLIYSHYWLSGIAACALRRRWLVPWAHSAHTLADVKNRNLAPGARPEPAIRAESEAEIARCADMLVVSTPQEGADLVRLYGTPASRLRVVEPGVDHELFAPGDRAAARAQIGRTACQLALFVGRLERLKGAEIAIRAVGMLSARHPALTLVVLGEDGQDEGESEAGRLAALARSLGIEHRVEFKGSVPHTELTAYYRAADALLMPSYSESFGLVGLEAQACGCPVIASNVDGLASVVRDGSTGYLVDGDRPEEYAERLDRLLSEPSPAAELGRRGAQRSRRMTWERTANRLLGAFSELTGGAYPRLQLSSLQE